MHDPNGPRDARRAGRLDATEPMMDQPTDGYTNPSLQVPDPIIGTLVDDRYRIESVLGRGGMGRVFRGTDLRLGRPVAIKLLPTAEMNDKRIESEVRTLARCAHPNLVHLYDAGEIAGGSYLVMELVAGPTLSQRISQGPLDEHETVVIGVGIASALAYIHQQRIVHRDVKPSNILLDEHSNPHLADFGISWLVDATRLTMTGLAFGTPAYLAPEQLQGGVIGPPVDVYALGLVLLECLVGRPAFEGTPAEVVAARLGQDPHIPDHVSPSWRALIEQMTARDPTARPSAALLAERLQSVHAINAPLSAKPADATVAFSPAAMQTDVLPTSPAKTEAIPVGRFSRSTRESGDVRKRVFVVALVTLVVVMFTALGFGGAFSNSPRHGLSVTSTTAAREVNSTSTTALSTTTTAMTTTTLSPLSSAGAAFSREITHGIGSGAVTGPVGSELERLLHDLLVAPAGNAAVDRFDRLFSAFSRGASSGNIAPSESDAMTASLAAIAGALGTSLPTTTVVAPKPAPPPAPGRGRGHGPGHGKKKAP